MENLHKSYFTKSFGEIIKSKRISKNITQSKLSELINVHENTIKKIEKGSICPNLYISTKLLKVLDIDIEVIYKLLLCDRSDHRVK